MKILKKDSLFKGTAMLSISLILTKILGAVYLIPFYQIIGGEEQMALFNYGYSYYATILEISGAGTPLAIAKLVSKYNAIGAYSVSRRIYKLGSWLLVVMGILGFCILFFGSGIISEQILISNQQKFTPQEGALVLKSLSFGIPLVLVSAGIRGLFQGHEIMLPSALSQFIEQVARIAFMLGATYFIMRILGYGVVEGNVSATFAAAVGAVFSLIILFFFYTKFKGNLDFSIEKDEVELNISTSSLVKEFFSVSIPFIFIVGLFPILNIIDQHNFIHGMTQIGKADIVDGRFSALQLVNKVVMIAVAIAPAFSSTFLPSITRLFAQGDKVTVSSQINKVILSLMMIVLPALVGMYVLADPIYSTFYSRSSINADLLRFYLPLAVLYSVYSLTSIIMQAVNKQLLNLIAISIGLVVKYLTITPFVIAFETNGVIFSSIATYVVMIVINLFIINREVKLKIVEFLSRLMILLSSCFIMFIAVAAVYESIASNFVIESKISSMTLISICAIFGILIYFFSISKMKFDKYLFGRKITLSSLRRLRR
ncbi:polysaccharide biosynthesis protein [uncultured Gemella sp.]|uniref:putative polysaccharide biosynthesis protein n=1 Tax=uncultured Gemella sp. TaxID=254352 RepID=UPI0028D3D8DC|nr:polysaccharide biosynthesis protein [uncultured Gemella sp.]